jgi:adenosylcobinamide-phosphate synthase
MSPLGAIPLLLGTATFALTILWVKSLFTVRGLLAYCARPLGLPIDEKRRETAKVVNRDTRDLPEDLLNSALVESLAENATDSVVSPLLYYGLLGLPGLVVYRATNTLDALLGHTDRRWRYVGWFAAKVDHIINVPGDRLTAFFLGGAANPGPRVEVSVPGTTLPKSLLAISSGLGVRLERRGSYVIGPSFPSPREADVRRAMGKVKRASYLAFALAYAMIGVMVSVGWFFLK